MVGLLREMAFCSASACWLSHMNQYTITITIFILEYQKPKATNSLNHSRFFPNKLLQKHVQNYMHQQIYEKLFCNNRNFN